MHGYETMLSHVWLSRSWGHSTQLLRIPSFEEKLYLLGKVPVFPLIFLQHDTRHQGHQILLLCVSTSGPSWLTCPMVLEVEEEQEKKLNDIWSSLLSFQIFTKGLPRSSSIGLLVHLPNTVSRQMGFIQGLPLPISTKESRQYVDFCMSNVDSYLVLQQKNTQWK